MQIEAFTCVAGQAFEAMAHTVANSARLVREYALHNMTPNRTFSAMSRQTGFTTPGDPWTEPASYSALDILERSNDDAGFSLYAGPDPDSRSGNFRVLLRNHDDAVCRNQLLVTGDATNGDFFALMKALEIAINFHEARHIFLTEARAIFGDKLLDVIEIAEFREAPPPAPGETPAGKN